MIEFDKSGMNEQEQKSATAIESAINKEMDSKAAKSDLENLATKDDVKSLEKSILDIKAQRENDTKKADMSLEGQVRAQLGEFIVKNARGEEFLDMKKLADHMQSTGKKQFTLDIKSVGVISTGNSTSNVNVLGVAVEPGLDAAPRAIGILREFASVTSISERKLTIGEYAQGEGGAAATAEGAEKPQYDADLTERVVSAAKIAAWSTVTEEMMYSFPSFMQELQNDLIDQIGYKEDVEILSGNGSSGHLVGIGSSLPGYTLTGLTVANPNLFDALVAAYTQIRKSGYGAYAPNVAYLAPEDKTTMELTKDADGGYLKPFFFNNELVSGVQIREAAWLQKGKFLIGDFRQLYVRDITGRGLTIRFGWRNDDFTKNQVTIVAEKDIMAYVKTHKVGAFVYDTFENVIGGITDESMSVNPVACEMKKSATKTIAVNNPAESISVSSSSANISGSYSDGVLTLTTTADAGTGDLYVVTLLGNDGQTATVTVKIIA